MAGALVVPLLPVGQPIDVARKIYLKKILCLAELWDTIFDNEYLPQKYTHIPNTRPKIDILLLQS